MPGEGLNKRVETLMKNCYVSKNPFSLCRASGVVSVARENKTWRLMEVLREATAFLEERGIENPRLNAERLLGHALGLSRMDLYLRFEQPLSPREREIFKTLLRRRASHEPLQYILGETEFMSLPFKVVPDVLIPRPETETLVERVVEEMKDRKTIRILDIGVGSGNLAVSLAHYLDGAEIVGVDVDSGVLSVAEENGRRNRVGERIRFAVADVREETFVGRVDPPFDAVVSNPPYVSLEEWKTLPEEIREHEPKEALCDGGDGFSFFRLIASRGKELLKSGGKLFFEVGDGQSGRVKEILTDSGYREITGHPDLNGIERVVRGVSKD